VSAGVHPGASTPCPGNRLFRPIEENHVTYAVIDGYELKRRRAVPAGAGR